MTTPAASRTVLFATDGSRDAAGAQQLLQSLPLPLGSRIHIVSVVIDWTPAPVAFGEMPAPDWLAIREQEVQRAEEVVRAAAAFLAREGLSLTSGVLHGEPAHQILGAAEDLPADLIVVGTAGLTGLEGFVLGSVARNVAKHAGCPVLVGRAPRHGLRRVVVAVDESEHAAHAAEFAGRLPLPAETAFTVTHVVRPYGPYPGLVPSDPAGFQAEVEEVRRRHRHHAEEFVAGTARKLEPSGRRVTTVVREGDPAGEVLKLAEEQEADLIVAGARGVSLIQGLFVGSVADRLLKAARCSVLLVR
jgi:nucleotide-binding universal stress UspA family protein